MKTLLFTIFLLTSCTVDSNRKSNSIDSVDFSRKFHSPQLETGIEGEDVYGPVAAQTSGNLIEENSQKTPILALDLSPALYQSFAYLKLFSELEKNKVNINIIISSGFSSIIAALYAKYKSANRLEWKTYALIRKIDEVDEVYSDKWFKTIKDFLDKEFGDLGLEQLKVLMAIPSYSAEDGKLELKYKGSVVNAIMASLNIQTSKESFLLKPSVDYFNKEKVFGVDKTFRVSAFPKRFRLKTHSGYVLGVYSKNAGFIHYKNENFHIIDSEKYLYLDKIPNISDLMSSVSAPSEEISLKILKSIEEWTNKNN